MRLKTITVHTGVVKAGMTVREVFEECTRTNTPGLPVCDDHDRVTGRVTLKHILKRFYLPDYLIEMAPILGEQISHVQNIESLADQLLDSQIEPFIQHPHASTTSGSSAVKALALMEKIDTGYLFIIDQERYQGVVTLQILCKAILHLRPLVSKI